MKKILFLGLLLAWIIPSKADTVISVKEDKVTQLIFPAKIKSFKGGFLPTDFAISTEENVLYIQPVGSFRESNMNIITVDGCYYAFTVRYDPQATRFNFVFSEQDAIYKEEQNRPNVTLPDSKNDATEPADCLPACKKIFSQPGYLLSRNIQRFKNFSVIVKGIYIDDEFMYFKTIFENRSNIRYDIDYIAFYIETIVKGKTSTVEKLEIKPRYVYNQLSAVNPKGEFEAVFCFDKFTIGADKVLTISVLESNGERNINLPIHNELIIEARRYE